MRTLFRLSDGAVVLNGTADSMPSQATEGQFLAEGYFLYPHHYFIDGKVTERPTSPVTRTDLTLLAVPEGSTLWINGESYDAEGTVELEFPLPGTYRLRVECFPFLDWTDEVVVP